MAKNPQDTKKFQRLLATLNGNEPATVAAWNEAHPDRLIETGPLSSKDQADILVAQAGLLHARGRVYVNADLIEAQVRVLKSGKPEVVRNTGDRHTKGVVVFRMDSGDTVAVQNLAEPN